MKIFGVSLVLSVVLTQVQRIRWMAYLEKNGFETKDIFVPMDIWIPFQLSLSSITIDILCIIPFIFLAFGGISIFNQEN